MKNTIYLLFVLLFTSCASFQVSTLNYDPIYGPDGTEIKVDTIDNEWELARKFRTDFRFRYDFARYAMNQPYSWYFSNRMFNRNNFYNSYSRFDMFHNSSQFWMNWAFDYPFNNFGYNWRDPFGFNNYYSSWNNYGMYGYGNYHNWNNGPWGNNGYNAVWNRSRENVSYNRGRRGSNNVTTNSNRTIQNNIIVNRNKPRIITGTTGNTLNLDNVDEIVKVIRGNKNNIRIYNNPNNVPPVIIRNNNNNNKPVRNYNRPPTNSNNNNSRPIRTYTPPSRSSSPPVIRSNSSSTNRSSTSVSRSGRGTKN